MKRNFEVCVYFDKTEYTKEEQLKKQAELFILLAEMKRESEGRKNER